jgi:tetratricopeptide (TPR) repeat protein
VQGINQLKFSQRLGFLFGLCAERLKVIWQTKRKEEFFDSFKIFFSFIEANFSANEIRNSLILIVLLFILGNFFLNAVTFNEIDRALTNQQSAKAENLVRQRLMFMPGNKGLQLRLAHAYLGLEREQEAKGIIESVQRAEPSNTYIPTVALALSQSLKRKNKSYEVIPILERVSVKACKVCKSELRDLYTIEGRNSLLKRNLERANYFLSKALFLAEKLQESDSSISHRKRELARAYNLQASQLIKAKEIDRAIQVLEKSVKVFSMGQTHLVLAKLYYDRQTDSVDLKHALESYEKAYSFGLTDPENVVAFKKALNKLKLVLKQEGQSKEQIEDAVKIYNLTENPTLAGKEQETNKTSTQNATDTGTEPKVEPDASSINKEQKTAKKETKENNIKANVYSDAADAGNQADEGLQDDSLEVE